MRGNKVGQGFEHAWVCEYSCGLDFKLWPVRSRRGASMRGLVNTGTSNLTVLVYLAWLLSAGSLVVYLAVDAAQLFR